MFPGGAVKFYLFVVTTAETQAYKLENLKRLGSSLYVAECNTWLELELLAQEVEPTYVVAKIPVHVRLGLPPKNPDYTVRSFDRWVEIKAGSVGSLSEGMRAVHVELGAIERQQEQF